MENGIESESPITKYPASKSLFDKIPRDIVPLRQNPPGMNSRITKAPKSSVSQK